MTIKEALKSATEILRASNSPSAYLDAEVLLLHALKKRKGACDKSWIYINSNYNLSQKEKKSFFDLIKKRRLHEPVAYIIGKKEFYGYEFYVDRSVLIPRPETEIMVSEALKIIRSKNEDGKIFDLADIGTGSGCIIISILNKLAKTRDQKSINAAIANDISKKAIGVAKKNSRKYRLNKKIRFIRADFSKMFKRGIFNNSKKLIITANLPYVKTSEYHRLQNSVKYEPKSALIGGKDGLKFIRKLLGNVAALRKNMKRDIFMFLESDPEQINIIRKLVSESFPDSENIALGDLGKTRRFVKIMPKH